jgi:hypothetical protein
MQTQRPQYPSAPKDKDTPAKQERPGRSGEGSRSVIPHMKADQKARAVARVEKRTDVEW